MRIASLVPRMPPVSSGDAPPAALVHVHQHAPDGFPAPADDAGQIEQEQGFSEFKTKDAPEDPPRFVMGRGRRTLVSLILLSEEDLIIRLAEKLQEKKR